MISILRPSTSPPKSSAAIFAAVSLPTPVISAYSPDMSRMAPSFSGGFDCAIAVVAAITIAAASNPDAILLIGTHHNHAASLLRGVFVVGAIMPQPTRSGKPHLERHFRNFPLN